MLVGWRSDLVRDRRQARDPAGKIPSQRTFARGVRAEQGEAADNQVETGTITRLDGFTFCAPFARFRSYRHGKHGRQASGIANEAVGKAKQGIGSVVGSDRLQAEGAAQEVKGDAERATGEAKDAIKKSINKVAGAVNKNL